MSGEITIRPASRRDASDMAILVDIAGYGLPSYAWRDMVESGEAISVMEAGRIRALRDEGSFSWRNAIMADLDGRTAGLLVGYRQPDTPEEVDLAEIDPVFRPLFELEALAPATWYVNVLATFAEFRSRGVGRALMAEAERQGADAGTTGLSLIVEDDNEGGTRLYRSLGFEEKARRPFVTIPGGRDAKDWILMVKAA